MTPNDFLRVLIDVVVESLQVGRPVALPGIGRFLRTGDPELPVRFESTASAEDEPAVASLVGLVSDRTGHDPAAVRAGLERFSASVRTALERGDVPLPGLGTLRAGTDRIPGFDPDPALAEAVNWDVAPVTTDSPSARPVESDPGEAVIDRVLDESNLPPLASPGPGRTPRDPRRPRPRPAAGSTRFVAGLLLLAAVVTVTVVVLRDRIPSREPAPPPSGLSDASRGAEEGADAAAAVPDSTELGADSLGAAAVAARPTVADLPVATEPAPPPASRPDTRPAPQPSTGDFDTSAAGFTLITASTTRAADASAEAAIVSGLGHPVAVLAYAEGGRTRYRVGVGRFPTIRAADSVRTALSDRLPAETWVRRIRP